MTQSLTAQCEDILAAVKQFEQSDKQDRAERLRLIQSLNKLTVQLKDPKEAIFDHFTNFVETCNLRALLELRVPETILRDGSATAAELAAKCGTDEALIARLMRILTVTGIFTMVGPDEYAHTRLSLAYLDGHEVDFFKLICDAILANTSRLPAYFAELGAKDTTSITINPFSWGNNKLGQTFFEIISQDENRLKLFDIAMSTQDNVLPVLGMYPFGTELANVPDTDTRALLVDIGGGRGHSLLQIQEEWPDLKGKFVLQDRPMVLNPLPEMLGIEKMAHDFFTPQPVQHAHAYYIRRSLHNWTDELCVKIFQQIVPAMASDSRVLVGEMVVPEYGSERPGNVEDMAPYWMDHAMFALGGRERTESDWRRLFDGAGLKLVKIWRSAAGSQAVLEARLA
ncbi:hypothetical protein ASPZODRAFT_18431 [Penicilliopsis zonata CBS 506.65]|uniref:Uncharacterized protein n=1 Tax=Penicilliopsis zonata CBS 506.65 TaxID=1073090 RepID=A0A1L9SAS2_9EURO|nr:hypothetical protein ASPZODRAFT_18431 [Penicilliopsis zonata CBS 506.65]OJJ44241.1 hypothetical protein ASPZODRAFT_18431 [Penicilliopsis zonata CBS 506.65]